MSDAFDPDKYLAEQSSDQFDPDSYLAETAIVPQETSAVDQLQAGLSSAAGGATGAAVGTGLGAAAQVGISKGLQKTAEKLGPYNPEQLSNIVDNYDQFMSLDPEQTMAKVEGRFRGINRTANELEKEAYSSLTAPLTREEYRKAVVKSSLPFTKDVPLDTPEFSDTAASLMPKRKAVDLALAQKQSQLLQFATLKAKERVANLKNASLGTMSEEQLLEEFNKTKAEVMANPEGFTFVPDQKAIADRNAAEAALKVRDLKYAEKEAISRLQSPLAKEFPELTGRIYSSSAPVSEPEVVRLLQEYKYGDKLTGSEPYQLVRNVRELAFDKNSGVRSEAAKALQSELRDIVGQKNPEASQKLQEMSGKIDELKKLEKAGYLKRDKTIPKSQSEFVQLGEKQAKQIAKDVAPNLFGAGATMTDDATVRLAQLKQTLPKELFAELEMSLLKEVALDPKRQLKIGAIDTVMAALSPISSAIGLGTKAVKTPKGAIAAARLAETLSEFRGRAGKALPGALGAAGALAGAAASAQAGEISPQEAAVLAPIEAINPTPLDVIGAYTEGKKEYEQSGSIPSTALAGAKGAVQPLVDIAKLAPSIVEDVGTMKSESARSAMEERYAKLQEMKESFKKKEFKPMQQAYTPAQVNSSLEAFKASPDPIAQTYVPALEKAANAADERTRGAIMFGLEQQPAFRELQRKNSK